MAQRQKLSKEEFRRQKDLEEARKAGNAPAEQDEDGKDINPHIPEYIKQAPWYLGFNRPTLKHQRMPQEKIKVVAGVNEWYDRGKTVEHATRFRKGACENCGAMTHKKRDCVERPRKLGAKFTNSDIAPDEAQLPDLPLDFDGKHDRWRGYDPAQYQQLIDEHEKTEQVKRKMKAELLKEELRKAKEARERGEAPTKAGAEAEAAAAAEAEGETPAAKEESESSDSGESEDDEKGYADQIDQPGTKFDTKRRFTVRNLRIREDTAKYLRNLDPNSAYYDAKTRTMRANPYAHTGIAPEELTYAGDNFIRYTGEVQNMAQKQLFAWDASQRGMDIHLQADPTMAEIMHKKFSEKTEVFKETHKSSVLEKYGGEEHLNAPPKELLLAQTEHYVEYSKSGRVIKGQEKAVARSKYEEDVFPGNHRSVWGSFWRAGRWGFACCHSFEKLSYCTGEAGKRAAQASAPELMLRSSTNATKAIEPPKSLVDQHREKLAEEAATKKKKKRKHEDDEAEEKSTEQLRQERIRAAMERQEREEKEAEALMAIDERKRPYHALNTSSAAPTEEEMEAYRLRQTRADDPMAQFLSNNK